MNFFRRSLAFFLVLATILPLSAAAADAPAPQMRGVWVSSVYNLDYPLKPTTDAASLKKQADTILDGAQKTGLNTIFLQVRPSSDALYQSDIFPWSAYLTGKQGTAPTGGFDPLTYWIDGAHARGIELHAWINPYRITKGKQAEWDALPAANPAKQHPEYVVQHDGNYYYDPGLPAARQLVLDGVAEILNKYDVDGVHLDDYFYPNTDFNDAATYARYGAAFADIGDWRRENVNILVRDLNALVHAKDPSLAFGISPAGVWANKSDEPRGSNTRGGYPAYSRCYADGLAWIKEGIIDYICPQIYWYMGQSAADYEILTDWWSAAVRGTDVQLYIGEATYKCGDKDPASPWSGYNEILKHLKLGETKPQVAGHIFFRYGSFNDVAGLQTALTDYYAALPTPVPPAEPTVPPQTDAAEAAGKLSYWTTFSLMLRALIR